jgi:hypothetical protein
MMAKDTGRTVSFSFESEQEKNFFVEYAREKGMTLSALAKMALFQYEGRFPSKRLNREKSKDASETVRTVQSVRSGDDLNGLADENKECIAFPGSRLPEFRE